MIVFITFVILKYWEEEIDKNLMLAISVGMATEILAECLLVLLIIGDINGTF